VNLGRTERISLHPHDVDITLKYGGGIKREKTVSSLGAAHTWLSQDSVWGGGDTKSPLSGRKMDLGGPAVNSGGGRVEKGYGPGALGCQKKKKGEKEGGLVTKKNKKGLLIYEEDDHSWKIVG